MNTLIPGLGKGARALIADRKWPFLLLVAFVALVFAVVMPLIGPNRTSSSEAQASLATAIPRLVFSLLAVAALLYGCLWGLRRLSRASRGRLGRNGYLEVVGSLPLGQRQTVHLVRVLDRLLVIGVAREEMRLLAHLPANSLQAHVTERSSEKSAGDFEEVLKNSFRDLISVSE